MQTIINCPVCQNPISVDTNGLLKGDGFSCLICHASIKIHSESIPDATKVFTKFNELVKNNNTSKG